MYANQKMGLTNNMPQTPQKWEDTYYHVQYHAHTTSIFTLTLHQNMIIRNFNKEKQLPKVIH